MAKAIPLLLLAQLAVSAFAGSRVTVDQLNRFIASNHGKRDGRIAGRLNGLELTERLSPPALAALEAALPGPESRRSLVVLADQAAFFDPPAAEIPNLPAPSLEQQRDITAKAVDYVNATLHRLPNLFALRDTIRFEDTPPGPQAGGDDPLSDRFIPFQPLRPVSRSTATVLYRDGEEIVQTAAGGPGTRVLETTGLTSIGEFGPILTTIFGDIPRGNLAWSHWEHGPAGPEPVFRFAVPKNASHYRVSFCCVRGRVFQQFVAYHGEIGFDVSNGTVLRVTLMADLSKADPVAKADMMVEYGPVVLGNQTYYCPARSISVFLAPMQPGRHANMLAGSAGEIADADHDESAPLPPLQTMLNEVVFNHYHLFRAEARILTGDNFQEASTSAAIGDAPSRPGPSSSTMPDEPPALTTEIPAAAGSTAGTSTVGGDAAALVGKSAVPAATTGPPSAPSSPEISVTSPADLSQAPDALPDAPANSEFSLSISTRLVDIGVTAHDKKGRPVTDLTREDFAVYDNGRKQNLRSFSYAGASPIALASAAGDQPVLYSNRPGAEAGTQSADASTPENSAIFLLDAASLPFSDLSHAREQVLSLLGRLSASEPVGLYVRAGDGFRILAEVTTDHAVLSSRLREWMPTAQDLARGQEAAMRNRQPFDTAGSSTGLASLNGITGGGWNPADAQPMREGGDPTRAAFADLVAVAAHLGAIPGHKNLVWIAGDNLLVERNGPAANTGNGATQVGVFSLRAQEALNDAHVSLYVLDASQLETSATDASLQNNSAEVGPPVTGMQPDSPAGSAAPQPAARAQGEMQRDLRPVQSAIEQVAQATGGRTFQRSNNIPADFNTVIEDGLAAYQLSFTPDTPPDDEYHQLTVTVPARRGILLRYRTGYLYAKEPSTLQDRFRQAIWQPSNATEIALSARRAPASEGAAVSLDIAANDLGMVRRGDVWTDKLDIFLVQRDDTGMHAAVKEQTLALNLRAATYQKVLRDGIPFDEYIDGKQESGAVRIIVVDENSGRLGSVTFPAFDTASP